MILTTLALVTLAPQNIFVKAHGLIETRQWHHEVNQAPFYRWLDHDLLIFMTKSKARTSIHLFDSQLRRIEALKVSGPFNESNGEVDQMSVSPDGKKLLWSAGGEQQPSWYICDPDSGVAKRFDAKHGPLKASKPDIDERSVLRWSRDGKSVFEMMNATAPPEATTIWERKLDSLDIENQLTTAVGYLDSPPEIIGNNLVLGHRGLAAGRDKPSVGFVTWNPENPSKTRQEWTVKVPNKQTIAGFEISHDGTRILWDLGIHNAKHSGPFDWAGEEFWISDLKGKNWKSLGRIMFNEKQHDVQSESLSTPVWVPGDKAISFTYLGELYKLDLNK